MRVDHQARRVGDHHQEAGVEREHQGREDPPRQRAGDRQRGNHSGNAQQHERGNSCRRQHAEPCDQPVVSNLPNNDAEARCREQQCKLQTVDAEGRFEKAWSVGDKRDDPVLCCGRHHQEVARLRMAHDPAQRLAQPIGPQRRCIR